MAYEIWTCRGVLPGRFNGLAIVPGHTQFQSALSGLQRSASHDSERISETMKTKHEETKKEQETFRALRFFVVDFPRRCSMTGFNRFSVFPRCVAAGALAIYILAASLDGRAQTTFGSITGNVTDANGAIVAGATIEATHVRSNYRY